MTPSRDSAVFKSRHRRETRTESVPACAGKDKPAKGFQDCLPLSSTTRLLLAGTVVSGLAKHRAYRLTAGGAGGVGQHRQR